MKNYFIYLYSFPNGKYYVGQSHHGSKRYGRINTYKTQLVYRAMKKYPNFKKEILVDNLTEEEVDDFEVYYINQYDSMSSNNGYNCDTGGNKNKVFSEITKKKLSDSHKGKHLSEKSKSKLENCNTISVNQYSKDNIFIKKWKSARSAGRELNIYSSTITECCKNKRKSAGGYIWRYADEEHISK